MDIAILILLVVVLVALLTVIVLLVSKKSNKTDAKDALEISNALSKQFQSLQQGLTDSINKSFKSTDEKIAEFNKTIGSLEKGQENLNELSKNILSLESILGSNQSTGSFGEVLLEQVLTAYFGQDHKLFEMQHYFPSTGQKADAAIFMPNEVICIDSKFPVHFYKQYLSKDCTDKEGALKELSRAAAKQIKECTKYIIEGETASYVGMFIPSDSLLALIHTSLHELIDTASANKVVLLSPSTLIPFISSLKMVKIDYEKNVKAKELYEALDALNKDFGLFAKRYEDLAKDIKSSLDDVDDLNITVNKLTKKFNKIKEMDFDDEQ